MKHRDRGAALFLLSHQNHLKCLLPVIERLAESSHPVHCAIPGEAVAKNRLTADQLVRLRRSAAVSVMRRRPLERLVARIAPRAFPRPRRWASRLGRLVRRRGLRAPTVVAPLHLPNLEYLRGAIGGEARIVCVQHDPYHSTEEGLDLGRFPVDLFCTWGRHMEQLLRRHGVRQPIRVTGAPHLVKQPLRQPKPAGEPLRLLYATQPAGVPLGVHQSPISPQMKHRAIADLLYAVGELPDARLTIKLHPADDGRIERAAVARLADGSGRVTLTPHQPGTSIHDFIDASDLVVTILSTVAFEALVRGRPIVLLDYDDIVASTYRLFGAGNDYLSEGVALSATTGPDLAAAVRQVLHDREVHARLWRSRERFLAKHLRYDSLEAQRRLCRVLTESGAETDAER